MEHTELSSKTTKINDKTDVDDDDAISSRVVTVTSSNYQELVKESKKDVLLEFYAPWLVPSCIWVLINHDLLLFTH